MRKYINSYCVGPNIHLEYKEDGVKKKEIIYDYKWYLVVTKEDFIKLEPVFEKMKASRLVLDIKRVGDYVKLYTECLNTKWKMDGRQALIAYLKKNDIKPLEGDIFADKKYCLDNNVEVSDDYNILYFDIETDDTNPDIVIGGERILSMAAVDQTGKVFYITNGNEKKLLSDILILFKKYDAIAGWNSGGFDLPYIKSRMESHNMRFFPWRSVAHVDLMQRMIKVFKFDSNIKKYSLDYICNYFLGEGKVDHSNEKIIDLYQNNPEKLKEYNIQDVLLLKKLDDKLDITKMMILQCQWCNIFLSNFFISELLDNFILKLARKNNIYCPTRDFNMEAEKYIGAIVLEPNRGLHDNVLVFDFKSLYPTMMMTSNIGFDTLDPTGKIINPGSGKRFLDTKDSIIKQTVEGLIVKRKEYKTLKLKMIDAGTNHGPEWEKVSSDEIVVKELSNSIYGIMGRQDSRWYSLDIAESITLFGQWCIMFTKEFFEDKGFEVIYGDTDSVFVKDTDNKLINNVKDYLDSFHVKLEGVLLNKYGIKESRIELEYEKINKRLLLVDKKTYSGHITELDGQKTDDIYTRGLDFIKKNTIKFAAKAQEELVDIVLHSDMTVDGGEAYIEKFKDIVANGKLSIEDLIIQTKMSRPVDTYKTKLPHVLVARRMIEENGILQSNEIEYIVKNHKEKEYITPEEFNGEYDKEYYWNHKVYTLLKRVLVTVFPNNDWEKYKIKKAKKK